ncbi:hypothetical protein [Streptomyces sp. NBC_00687]|uniref:hypothetical protein n=1 Tax=Streptomyces sp. NBC_00687 TaxID=2975807 RepID=UPI00224F655A|nr:hypothetical protein [Streptomyces sp. NBC_00687]MCX4912840.1 hypothetical protein [Streptomyces sp. NBC_00687]
MIVDPTPRELRRIFDEIRAERARQDERFGEQNHPDGTGGREWENAATMARANCDLATVAGELTWRDIAYEEDAEALAESDPVKLRAELIQAAAVKVAWIEHLDRRALAARCQRCKGQKIVPDFTNWDTDHAEPLPKPCPDCQGGDGG